MLHLFVENESKKKQDVDSAEYYSNAAYVAQII